MQDKSEIIKALLDVMESNLRRHFDANKSASDGATNVESRAETKWDTCGLEASYLARGHAIQFKQTAAQVDELRTMKARSFVGQVIGIGALVEVEIEGERMLFFLMHHGGGIELKLDMGVVTVITPESPVGTAMAGKGKGDQYPLKSGLTGKIKQVY
ncbi:MAG: hypothetical protein HOH33_00125 [Verrucomicrobia bacterium]|jgi:hypothetical protein|nr:hypothetical protein [Verrucomicrobiota bacterium]